MQKFAKSILNYFAAYTETRFNFKKKTDYIWTDNSFTVDFSVFPEFQKNIIQSLKDGKRFEFAIRKGEYSISLDIKQLKSELLATINKKYSIDALNAIIREQNEKSSSITDETEKQKHVFQESTRKYNLVFRDEIKNVLTSIQKEKIEKIKDEFRIIDLPLSTLNTYVLEQEVYDQLQRLSRQTREPDEYIQKTKDLISNISFDLTMYDLYSLLQRFVPQLSVGGSLYLFFHEMKQILELEDGVRENKYPIFMIETELDEKNDNIIVRSAKDIVVINTPAINSFGFDNVLTTPRAARFVDAAGYLYSVEKHLQNTYNIYEEFLLTQSFRPLSALNKPGIRFRIGLQIVQNENRKLVDYSELITHIDAGLGDKFIDFTKTYISGNVKNTTDEVDRSFKAEYPRKTANYLLSTIPIKLNENQKRIMTALQNQNNKIIVVDGPPGTGKSHTIAAIVYWANEHNKSIVITSHKKAALDVLDRMLTDKFKGLHPMSKPSIIRLSENEESINSVRNALSGPAIAAATNRTNQFNEEAVEKDHKKYFEQLELQVKEYWKRSEQYQKNIGLLMQYETLKASLVEMAVVSEDYSPIQGENGICIDFDETKKLIDELTFNCPIKVSIDQIKYLFETKENIGQLMNACNVMNRMNVEVDPDAIMPCQAKDMEAFRSIIDNIKGLVKDSSKIFEPKQCKYRFSVWLKAAVLRKNDHQNMLLDITDKLNGLEYVAIIGNISLIIGKGKNELSLSEVMSAIKKLDGIEKYVESFRIIKPFANQYGIDPTETAKIYKLLKLGEVLNEKYPRSVLNDLNCLKTCYCGLLQKINIEFDDVRTLKNLFTGGRKSEEVLEFVKLDCRLTDLSQIKKPDQAIIEEYYHALHKQLENVNDKRLKNLNNKTGDIERILVAIKAGKRLKEEELKVILENISCVISEPDLISKYFPMKEDSIDLLVIDEASQVSIADSISLILRAKQVVVFGDEFQYGAVSAVNVNQKYSKEYFREILNGYEDDYRAHIEDVDKNKISDEASKNVEDEDLFVEPLYKPEEGTKDWLKTFSIRTSTLNFAKALRNYGASLDVHFRSFPEIIEYSNETFYRKSSIPLIVNRIRTKPISEVLRFISVQTQGNSGQNVNYDEIDAVKNDILNILNNGFKGTIGIITSFREQKSKMEEVLRKDLPNYQALRKDNKLEIWFVGDVQGEERDIVYYSFVEDNKIGNADLRTIYPTIGGTADNIRSLKMQRLNVGFSRAKDTMVFIHSMDIGQYSNSRLGDALKLYKQLAETTKDNYIKDEAIFGSPAEKNLYALLTQTEFYRKNVSKIMIVPQFPIGEYIQRIYHRYMPKFRVDFLVTLADGGKEQSLILEYDGVEFHTKNPEIVTKYNFTQEYLEYDIQRQLELESYGYRFLRINKFTLRPKDKAQTKVDVLNNLLTECFNK